MNAIAKTGRAEGGMMPQGGADDRLAVAVPEVGRLLGCGTRTVWRLLARGALSEVRAGRRRLVSLASVREFVSKGGVQ